MSVEDEKHALEERRRRLKRQGQDLDIIDKVRLQRVRSKREDNRRKIEVKKLKGYQTRRTRGGKKQKRR